MSIILFIIILAVLILAHEFGHFIVAKKCGIRVDEFGIGFPPKLYGKKYGETEYTINALPLGGFVKIYGENPEDEEPLSETEKARSFAKKPKWIQIAVLCAGVTFNILLAWLLITTSLIFGSQFSSTAPLPNGTWVEKPALSVVEVLQKTPAEKMGIKAGDVIVSYSEKTDKTAIVSTTPEAFQDYVSTHGTSEISILLKRGAETKAVSVIPMTGIVKDKPAIGIAMDMVGKMKLPAHLAVIEGANLTALYTSETFKGVVGLIGDAIQGKAKMSSVSGPVGIVKIVGDTSKFGFERLLVLTAIISINLAVVNILPIPALDGGRVFFVLIEAVKRSPIKPKFANMANMIGFFILITLILVITFSDIWKLFVG